MTTDKSQVFRFQVERREIGIQDLVMTEHQFKSWFIANGGRLIGKEPLAADTTATATRQVRQKNRISRDRDRSRAKSKPEAESIPTITIMSGDQPDDPLYASLVGSDCPVLLAIDEPSGMVRTLLMPNTVTKLL